jgi:hypothetical protein
MDGARGEKRIAAGIETILARNGVLFHGPHELIVRLRRAGGNPETATNRLSCAK